MKSVLDMTPAEVRIEAARRAECKRLGIPLTADPPTEKPVPAIAQLELVILGAPRTKKNSQKAVGIQSQAYSDYKKLALSQIRERFGENPPQLAPQPYNLEAHYYVDRVGARADLVGLLQATCDILENAGLIENDNWFRGLDRSRPHYPDDADYLSPRAVISVTPL